jgi:hypothetical protein
MTIREVLVIIGKQFNDEEILWGVGGSVMLNYYGLAENPRDIDLVVSLADVAKVEIILSKLGKKQDRTPDSLYETEHFLEYVIQGVDVDIMAGLNIIHEAGIYSFEFDAQSVAKTMDIDGVQIPLTSLADWYVIYQLLGDREAKVERIENYMNSTGLINAGILEKSLVGNLPKEVKARVETLLVSLCTEITNL